MDKIEQQREHYEKVAEKYYSARQSKNHILFKTLLWKFFLKDKQFLKKRGLRVLEPMCGFAEGKQLLEGHLDIDISYEGYDYCETIVRTVKGICPSVNVYRMDATKFIPSRKYDLILLIGGLHHIPDHAENFVGSLYNSLVEGGYFINFEPTQNNLLYKFIREFIYQQNSAFSGQTERAFELHELNNVYTTKGFEIVDQIYPGLLTYILYFNPEAFPFFDIGDEGIVNCLFNADKLFFRNLIGRRLSFATLTLLRK